jgi:hypothetical protein
MEHTGWSETSAHKIQTSGNQPKERIQHSEQGESFEIKHTNFIWQQMFISLNLNSA